MPRFVRCLAAVWCLALPVLAYAGAHRGAEFDECQADFIAFIGSDAYQFSPLHSGELGSVRLFTILSYQRAAAMQDSGRAFWRLTIRPAGTATARAVFQARDVATLDLTRGAAFAELRWDGRDADGRLLPAGKYAYTFEARFLPDAVRAPAGAASYEDLAGVAGVAEAFASTEELVLDPALGVDQAQELRTSAAATTCEIQQNAPLEAGFGYNFYYGSTHAHTNYSDGGQPTTSCSSGNAYGSGSATPTDAYSYARFTSGLDFWVINEHNHLINDAVATNNPPVTEAKVRQRYQDGRAAADAASVNDSFIGIYGMEWGITSNTDQGHVTLLDTPTLFGWETCTNCNGPNPECTPGTNCYFDVFTPRRFGYLTMYQRSVQNPSLAGGGALGIMCHPGTGNFDNYAFDANADQALQGIAVRSGLAFSTATNCSTANVGATDYSVFWRDALNRGFHLGPVADHDSHCINYGQALPTRTVYLIGNGGAPVLTKANLLQAHRARHFFASEDPNAQLVFGSADGAHVMGDIFNAASGLTLRAAVYDPNGESVSTLELWRGQVGAGTLTAAYRTFSNQSSLSVSETLTSGTYYYFVHAVQADGHDLWSAPMWITYSASSDTQAPTTSITSPAGGSTVSGTVTVAASASDNVGVTSVEFYLDGALQSTDTTSPYSWSWNTGAAGNGAHTLTSRARDAAGNVGTSAPVSVTVSNVDTQAPSTSITSPAAGATVSGSVAVAASASDNVGVTSVEFYLDGVLRSTDTTSPYQWTWDTTTSANGAHTLSSRAYDAAGNVGTSAGVSVTVNNVAGLDISGWRITQANSSRTYNLPAGTVIPSGGYVIVARDATKAAFETFWRAGTPLPSNVVYVNSAGAMPVINGSENYTLTNAAGTTIDGRTINMASGANQSVRRNDPCLAAGTASSWTTGATTTANPGSGAGVGCGRGVVINEFSDAAGTGNFIYEFVELHHDN